MDGINIMHSKVTGRWVAFVPSVVPPASILRAMRWALDRCYLPRLRSAPAGLRRDAMQAKVDALETLWRNGMPVDQFVHATSRREVEMTANPAPRATKLISIGG